MSLVGEERKQRILELLEEYGKVISVDLANMLNVSKESIRRYLDDLEQEGLLRKVYGGAIKNYDREEQPHITRLELHKEEKNRIGQIAAGLVKDGEVLFLDEGTTPMAIIPHLTKSGLTIITNSWLVVSLLMERAINDLYDGRILWLGGEINAKHARSTGPVAEEQLDHYYVDKAFISVDGIDAEAGLTCLDDGKAAISRKAIAHATETIILTDHSKLGKRYMHRIQWSPAFCIVCDQPLPKEWKPRLAEEKLKWLTTNE
ncbi:DeoR/GlpR family DNA-binding transcription regulator [Paenibacillus sp. OV219]|uniref:DeoR/GlpR family DNA-binding transcription regulator n=1 Tax=Paenibacillus sp. OV219 TaxID=1884377 RepID=UPI0008CDCCEE|nr:DeoR/GlpR family DNA-binding transcription regulator [Paenibacillus sp. OV219]SEO33217.1 transcriptional regulator, DeoR family [Paenibacillus sp. OV219]